jgi:hypothetical protein
MLLACIILSIIIGIGLAYWEHRKINAQYKLSEEVTSRILKRLETKSRLTDGVADGQGCGNYCAPILHRSRSL